MAEFTSGKQIINKLIREAQQVMRDQRKEMALSGKRVRKGTRGWQARIAEKLQLSSGVVCQIINGDRPPSAAFVERAGYDPDPYYRKRTGETQVPYYRKQVQKQGDGVSGDQIPQRKGSTVRGRVRSTHSRRSAKKLDAAVPSAAGRER